MEVWAKREGLSNTRFCKQKINILVSHGYRSRIDA